jgi:putative peptide maturation dehydrogenase
MRIRRCSVLLIEPREELAFDLGSLSEGGDGLRRRVRWLAHASHLEAPVELDAVERELLGSLSPSRWSDLESFADPCRLDRLLQTGLAIADGELHALHRQRDIAAASSHWWTPAAVTHYSGRWQGLDCVSSMRDNDLITIEDFQRELGVPPCATEQHVAPAQRISLSLDSNDEFNDFLKRRVTCRNFSARRLSAQIFARMMRRVFAAQGLQQRGKDTVFLKKTSPSGGGLHATEAYLIVQNVEGVEPGLYHYHPVDHALEPLPPPELPLDEFAKLAVAGQHWFANAPALVVLTPRFARSFWKYRHHAKAYRALILDSGHLSQTLYLSATELGLGAFVTSAINEIDIEQAFALDPLEEGPLAICGFGWRAERMETTEFDPAGEVWEATEGGS